MGKSSLAWVGRFAERIGVKRAPVAPRKVYFLAAPSVNLIKIGCSDDPTRRFNELRLLSPVPLEVKAIFQTFQEKDLHARFAHIRSHGEWFFATSELLKGISILRFSEGLKFFYEELKSLSSDERNKAILAAIKANKMGIDDIKRIRIYLQKIMNAKCRAQGKPLPFPETQE